MLKNWNVYQIAGTIIFIIGLIFSYIIAEFDDAPGFILVGGSMSLFGSLILYGIGEMVTNLKEINNKLNK